MSKISLNTAAKELVRTLGDRQITEEEFRATLATTYPQLMGLSTFEYYSVYNARKAGYTFKSMTPVVTTIPIEEKNDELSIVNIGINDITDSDIATFKTGTYFDIIASDFGGFMGGVQYEVSAPAGTGKTTLLTQIGQYLKENNDNFTTLFISGEMSRRDWKVEVYKNPSLSGIDTIFLSDYDNETDDILTILIKALGAANYVIVDSASSITEFLIDELDMKPKTAEKWLRREIIKASEKNNSIIMSIKHVNKDGKTAGGTKDKHMFTGRLILDMESANSRFAYFEKNRRGGENQFKRLYFKKDAQSGRLTFDAHKFDNDREVDQILESQNDNQEEFDKDFKDIFMKQTTIVNHEDSVDA